VKRYIVRRLLLMAPVILIITAAVTMLMRVVPGDPALVVLGQTATEEDVRAFHEVHHLDDPVIVQYLYWWGDVLRGDLGESIVTRTSVSEELKDRLPTTIEMLVLGTLLTVLIGVPAGVISAVRRNTLLDYGVRSVSVAGLSIPSFWLGTLFLLLPAIWWDYLPPIGKVDFFDDPLTNLEQFILPALVLAIGGSATVMRLTRSAVLETMRNDYVRTAYAKGLREQMVIGRHVLKNSMIPVVTVVGLEIAGLFGGAVLLEVIFNLPGVGLLFLGSITSRDYPAIQGLTLFIAVIFLLINLLIDLSYAWLDPRIRYS
jgi:peptide/nickel transport system permease protein